MGLLDIFRNKGKENISRREFIKRTGATTAALMTVPSSGSDRRQTSDIRNSDIYDSNLEKMNSKEGIEYLHERETVSWNSAKDEKGPVKFKASLHQPSEYGSKWSLENEKAVAVNFEAANNSNKKYVVQLTTVIPSGWAYYGFIDVSSAGGGLATSAFEIDSGEKRSFTTFIYDSGTGGKEIELVSTYYPVDKDNNAKRTESSLSLD